MVKDSLVIIGLPSSGLDKLTRTLDIRQIDDSDIRRVYDHPDQHPEITPEWISGRWAALVDQNGNSKGLLIYQTPWGLLDRQLQTSQTALNAQSQLESYARKVLRFWHTYHLALYGLRRQHDGQFMLINGDRPIDIAAIVALLENRFTLRPNVRAGAHSSDAGHATRNHAEIFSQIVDAMAPECLELYAELESCAELMGRQPEFDFSGLSRRHAFLSDLLEIAVRQGRIERLLQQHGADAVDVELHLERVLSRLREFTDSEPKTRRNLSELNDRLNVLQQEAAHQLLQVRQLEEKLHSRDVQIDGYLTKVGQLEGELRSRQADTGSHLARVRQLEEELATKTSRRDSLESENELYLLQLHQMQEELEHYFELSQEKEKQLADLRQQLELQTAPLMRKLARTALVLKDSVLSVIASPTRSVAGWFWWTRKEERVRRRQTQTIRKSRLFDEKWYLQQYPDVAQAGCEPIEHYLRFGAFEARNPSARFDTRWYLDTYPDVANARVNPLLHYIEFGKNEGRQPTRFES